jgi:hypothetical protein
MFFRRAAPRFSKSGEAKNAAPLGGSAVRVATSVGAK